MTTTPISMNRDELRALRLAARSAGLVMTTLDSDDTPRAVASFTLRGRPHSEALFAVAVEVTRDGAKRRLVMSHRGARVDCKGH